MDYQTLINEATNWMFSDLTNGLFVIGTIAIIGMLNGIRLSLQHCKITGHRRVL